jgi:hypothetical protein
MRSVATRCRRRVPGAPRPGRLRLRGLEGGSQALIDAAGTTWPSPTGRTTWCSSAGRAPARRTWPRPSAWPASPGTASGCASTRRSIWSMRWSRRRPQGKAGRIAFQLLRMDLVILDELGYLPFSQAGGALLFHLLSKLYEHTSVMITTNLDLRRVGQRVRRREDDHRAARPAHAPLPHRGDRQRVLPLPPQQRPRPSRASRRASRANLRLLRSSVRLSAQGLPSLMLLGAHRFRGGPIETSPRSIARAA